MASGLGLGGGGGGGTSSALVLPTSPGGRDEVNELRQQKSTFLQSSGELAELLLSLRREMDFEQKTLAHIRYVLGNLWERITGVAREMSVAGGANASVTTSALDPAVSTQQTLQMTLQEKDRVYESVSEEELTLKKKLEALYDLLGAKNESLVAATERGQPAMSDDFKNFEEEIVDLTTTIETTQDELSRLAMRRDDVRHEALMIQRRMNDGDIVLHSAPSKGLDPVEALRRSIDAGLMQAIGGDLPAPLDSAVVMAERLTGEADEQLRGRREVTFADFMKLDGKVARFAGEDPRLQKSSRASCVVGPNLRGEAALHREGPRGANSTGSREAARDKRTDTPDRCCAVAKGERFALPAGLVAPLLAAAERDGDRRTALGPEFAPQGERAVISGASGSAQSCNKISAQQRKIGGSHGCRVGGGEGGSGGGGSELRGRGQRHPLGQRGHVTTPSRWRR